jgi:AcrR family transcriptional regulator
MAVHRAIAVEDKETRRREILDAAERLFLEHPDRMASVSEVAAAAGVAKGTVYLYFPSKEEMLLALHERHVENFFEQLIKKVSRAEPIGFDDVMPVTLKYLIRWPGYLELTTRCFSAMDREMPIDTALAFKARVAQRLQAAGVHLDRHFAKPAGSGVALLLHSYGLIVGLWQLHHPNERFGVLMKRPELKTFDRNYETEIETALRALWRGWMMSTETRKSP